MPTIIRVAGSRESQRDHRKISASHAPEAPHLERPTPVDSDAHHSAELEIHGAFLGADLGVRR